MRIDNERTPATKSDFFLLIGLLKGPALFFGVFCLLVFLSAMFPRGREPEIKIRPKIEPRLSLVSKVPEPKGPVKQAVVPRERAARSLQYGIDIEAANEILGVQGNLESLMSGNGRKLESYSWTLPNGKTLLGEFKNGLLEDWGVQSSPMPVQDWGTNASWDEREEQTFLQELEGKFDDYMQNARNLDIVISYREHNGIIDVVVDNGFYQLPYGDKNVLAKNFAVYHVLTGRSDIGLVRFYDRYTNKLVGKFYGGMEGKLKLY